MKMITSLLISLLAFSATAQQKRLSPIPMDGAPGVEVLGTFLRSSDEGSANFYIEIRNTGKDTIKAISWEYYLSMPSGSDIVDIRLSPTTEGLALKPGETKMLRATVRHILDPLISTVSPSKIRLMRGEYEGATTWQRAAEQR